MGDFMKKAMEAYEQQVFGNIISGAKKGEVIEATLDSRYNTPKTAPKASEEDIDKAIEETEIYKQAKERILKFQRNQVGYGLDKYPETLNASTWTEIETQHHIIEESVDKLHYEVMRLIQLERKAEKELEEFKSMAKADTMSHMERYLKDLDKLEAGTINFATMEEADKVRKQWKETPAGKAIPIEHSQMHGYSMNDAEATAEVWKAYKEVSSKAGADTDGDYGDIRDDKIDALAYSFGHLGTFSNSGKTINDIRKDKGLEPIETVGVRLSSEEIQEIGKVVAQCLKKEADRHA